MYFEIFLVIKITHNILAIYINCYFIYYIKFKKYIILTNNTIIIIIIIK